MNEKLQYATMLEMPVSTCSVTRLATKKKRVKTKKKPTEEQVKDQLLQMVNSDEGLANQQTLTFNTQKDQEQLLDQQVEQDYEQTILQDSDYQEVEQEDYKEQSSASVSNQQNDKAQQKAKFRFSVVGVQLVVIGVLVATIFLTNALFADSGINVFLRSVFSGQEQVQTDTRMYLEFAPVVAMGDNKDLSVADGIISFAGEGSVYSACDGKVVSITQSEDGFYDIEIMHSDNFKSIISGVDHIYVEQGQQVYRTIPVGYLQSNGANMCFADSEGSVITDYQIDNGIVKWAV